MSPFLLSNAPRRDKEMIPRMIIMYCLYYHYYIFYIVIEKKIVRDFHGPIAVAKISSFSQSVCCHSERCSTVEHNAAHSAIGYSDCYRFVSFLPLAYFPSSCLMFNSRMSIVCGFFLLFFFSVTFFLFSCHAHRFVMAFARDKIIFEKNTHIYTEMFCSFFHVRSEYFSYSSDC